MLIGPPLSWYLVMSSCNSSSRRAIATSSSGDHLCSGLFDFHLFADDANLFYKHKNINTLQSNINDELKNVHIWLCANKLSLNIVKSNFVIFHPPQRKISVDFQVFISGKPLKREICIKYLGIYIDSNLSWKPQIDHISEKIKRSIGILSKLRYYVNISVLTNLYYALVYPFLIYGITAWGNTYPTTLKPVCTLQKNLGYAYYDFFKI